MKQTGHNRGVDWWACGILIHELLHGETPFCDDNQHQMFKMIMQSAIPKMTNESKKAEAILLVGCWKRMPP